MRAIFQLILRVLIWLRDNARPWLIYIYFLRFSILLWLTMPLLALLDIWGVSTSVTRVLLTMSDGWQAFYATASLVLLGWVAMLLARLVCVYGPRRFVLEPPAAFAIRPGQMRLRVLLWSQLPGLALLAYILWLSLCDAGAVAVCTQPAPPAAAGARFAILVGALIGILAAAFIWFLTGWIYYLTHDSAPPGDEIWEFILPYRPSGEDPVSRLMRHIMGRAKNQQSPVRAPQHPRIAALARALGPGYLSLDDEGFSSGHTLATSVALAFVLLYFLVAYISFPLPGASRSFASIHSVASFLRWLLSWSDYLNRALARHLQFSLGGHTWGFGVGVAAFFLATLLLVAYLWARTCHASRGGLLLAASLLCGTIWIVVAREPHYPAIATILTLLMLFGWVLGGLSFFLDRFRVPAFFVLLALLFFYKRILPTDHVYPAKNAAVAVPKGPGDIVEDFEKHRASASSEDDPMIVITATGGGIHAAYWTAMVLDGLEDAFQQQNSNRPLKNRILLMSSVSGGSVAAGNWIAQHAAFPDLPLSGQLQRLHEAANQPALEAVAWGLLHTDLWEMLVPLPRFIHDRAWFLEQANLANLYLTNHPPPDGQKPSYQEIDPGWNDSKGIVTDLKPSFESSNDPNSSNIPAFSLNATVVETGERFLLSNYMPPSDKTPREPLGILPWQSALSFYSQYQDRNPKSVRHFDLPISTAARLSAAFTYVSPVARADVGGQCPIDPDNPSKGWHECGTFHLADGGYYDNDGVATAVEFLWLAFGKDAADQARQRAANGQPPPDSLPAKRQRILLIQIRDSPLPSETDLPAAWFEDNRSGKHDVSQTSAPVDTVYNSWHASESTRNQRELSALQAAMPGAKLSTVAFSFPNNLERCCWPKTSPGNTTLNWRLTNSDQLSIQYRWSQQKQCAVDVATWADAATDKDRKTAAAKAQQDCSGKTP